jgi:hypothetical protein
VPGSLTKVAELECYALYMDTGEALKVESNRAAVNEAVWGLGPPSQKRAAEHVYRNRSVWLQLTMLHFSVACYQFSNTEQH